MKKRIEFSAAIDTKEFDRSISEMTQRLRSIYQGSDSAKAQFQIRQEAAAQGVVKQPTPADKTKMSQEENRSRRELTQFIREQVKEQEKLASTIEKQTKEKEKLRKLAKEDYDSAVKLLDIEKKIGENRQKMSQSQEATMAALQARRRPGFDGVGGLEGAMSRGAEAFAGAGRGGAGIFGQMGAGLKGFGRGVAGMGMDAVIGGLGALTTAGYVGSNLLNQQAMAPLQILGAQASARTVLAQPAIDMMEGRGLENAIYAPEAQTALSEASEAIDTKKIADNISIGTKIAGVLLSAGAGAKFGGTAGFVGGAALGGIGALPGAAIGTIGGAIAGGGAALLGTGLIEDVNARRLGTYQAEMEQQRADIFRQNFENMKQLDPTRRYAVNRYEREMMPNLQMMRATGMSEGSLEDRLLQGTESGFTMDMTRQAMSGILGAGGSSESARQNATFVNQLQRNMNLTNAGDVVGRLSGLTTGASEAQSSTVKILAEAVGLGLDTSKFAAENRRFVDISTQVIQRSGAIDANAQANTMQGLSQFVAGPEMFRLQGAQSAYELTQQISGEAGGARGAIQAAAINRSPTLSQLNMDQRNQLLQLTEEQIRAGGPMLEGMAATAGISLEDLQKEALDVKSQSRSTRADIDQQAETIKSLAAQRQQDTPEYKEAVGKYLAGMGMDVAGITNLSPAGQEAFIQGNVLGQKLTPERRAQLEAEMEGKVGEGPSTRPDQIIASRAAGDQAFLRTVDQFKSSIDTASENITKFSSEVVAAAEALAEIKRGKAGIEELEAASKRLAEVFAKLGIGQEGPRGRDLVETQEVGGPSGQ